MPEWDSFVIAAKRGLFDGISRSNSQVALSNHEDQINRTVERLIRIPRNRTINPFIRAPNMSWESTLSAPQLTSPMTTLHAAVNLGYPHRCQQIDSEFSVLANGEQNLGTIFSAMVPQLLHSPFVHQKHRNRLQGEMGAPQNPVSHPWQKHLLRKKTSWSRSILVHNCRPDAATHHATQQGSGERCGPLSVPSPSSVRICLSQQQEAGCPLLSGGGCVS